MNALSVSTAISTGRVNLITNRQRSLTMARWRALWLAMVFVSIGLVALSRLVFLGLSDSATTVTSLEQALLPPRGELTDRNGIPLARAFPAYALWYNPDALGEEGSPLVKSPQQVADELVAIFPDLDREELVETLIAGKPTYLRRRVLPEDANKVQAIGELALEMPHETGRYYPQGSMAAHVLGYVDASGNGQVGMEEVLDERLKDPALRGEPVALSIDMREQGCLLYTKPTPRDKRTSRMTY